MSEYAIAWIDVNMEGWQLYSTGVNYLTYGHAARELRKLLDGNPAMRQLEPRIWMRRGDGTLTLDC